MSKRQKFTIHFVATVFTTFIMVFFMNSWCVVQAFQGFFESGQNIELTAFVFEGVPEESIQTFIEKYEKYPGVFEIKRQSAEESFETLKAELKLFDFQMTGLDISKVLPQIITLKMTNFDSNLIAEIKENKIVDELLDGRHWLTKNANIINLLRWAGAAVAALCLSSLVLALSLLIKTHIQFEREEISLRAMHGEALWRLRKTYIVKGFAISAGAALFGIISTQIGALFLQKKILTQFDVRSLAEQINPLGVSQSIMILLVVGICGILVALYQTSGFKREFYLQK